MNVLTEKECRLIKALDEPMPVVSEPFAMVAEKAGMSHEEVLDIIRAWQANGVIRRFGARVRHHAIGYAANGMSVWNVPDEKIEQAAAVMTAMPQVSHCYQRPKRPGWDYNMYAMIHGKTDAEVRAVAVEIARRTRVSEYDVLFSSKELKKSAPKYGDISK